MTLNEYFSKDVCEIIKDKLKIDHIKYKIFCKTESRWVEYWSHPGKKLECPNSENHLLYLDCIFHRGEVPSNGKIIRHIKNVKEVGGSMFEIVKI